MYKYLQSLCTTHLEKFDGVYVIEHPRKPGSWYYVSSYNNFINKKDEFFKFLEKYGQTELRSDWDFHHIVEKVHLKPFYDDSTVKILYNNVWPTVLLHKTEHQQYYNSMFQIKETSVIFPKGKDIRKQFEITKSLYSHIYSNDYILKKIAENVLNEVGENIH